MRSGTCDSTVIENVDFLRGHRICQTMRDHDNGLGPSEFTDGPHDIFFRLHIYIACGLVEDVDRRIVEDCAGEG